MSYTAPPTFVSGDPLAADDLNVLGDDIAALKAVTDGVTFSGAFVSRTASTGIPNNTATAITFTAETFDFGSWWSSGSTIIVPAGAIPAGVSTIAVIYIARTKFGSNNAGYRKLAVLQNGSELGGSAVGAVDGAETEINVFDFALASAGDTFSIEVTQTAGTTIDVAGTGLTVVRYAPAS